MRERTPEEHRDAAARYCAAAEHCEQEVRQKLYQWECPASLMDGIIDYLIDEHYIDSDRYCRAYVHDKVAFQGWGRQKIAASLRAKSLPSSSIRQAIENIDENEYFRQLHRLIAQKKGTDRERTMRFLLQRGFTYDEIESLL